MSEHLSEAIAILETAAHDLVKACKSVQLWEGERERKGRLYISGTIDAMIGGITDTLYSLSNHLAEIRDGELVYKDSGEAP